MGRFSRQGATDEEPHPDRLPLRVDDLLVAIACVGAIGWWFAL